jgi:isovaleryl-CoA dehydrogenase
MTEAASTEFATTDLFNPTDEHEALRRMVRDFVENEVEPQAADSDRAERFNLELFRKLGDLGPARASPSPPQDGGAGHGRHRPRSSRTRSSPRSDPGLCARLPRALPALRTNNLAVITRSAEQRAALPAKIACSGEWVGGMCMSEPAVRHRRAWHAEPPPCKRGDRLRASTAAKMWITNGAVSETELGDMFPGLRPRRRRPDRNKVSMLHRREGLQGLLSIGREDQGQARAAARRLTAEPGLRRLPKCPSSNMRR